ncbi:MAG TPA: MATE family efflux transporter [Vicinamibacteria bacterium]|nr:MATE family efflux transporter [Vicinamibacteria bacterium]
MDSQEDVLAEAPPAASTGLMASVRESLRGTEQDFTSGNLNRAVGLLAIPMVLEMAGESVFAVCDAFFVARLGPEALASVGLTESMLEIIYAVAVGLAMATTAMIARRTGEKNPRGAARAAVQAIVIGIVLAATFGAAGAVFAPDLLALMGASPETVAMGTSYTRVMYAGMVTILLLFLNNAIYRGAGDATSAMRALWIANAINLVLDPCLIFGLGPFPELGLMGAAVATNIGRGTGVLYQLYGLTKGQRIRIRREDLLLDFSVIKSLMRLSAGGVGQMLIATASYVGLIRILATFGSAVLAGYVVAIRIVIFVILPAWGLSNAAATLVGQNLGARKPDRAERAVWLTGVWTVGFMGFLSVVFLAFASPIIHIFTTDPDSAPVGIECLRIISYGYVFYAWGMVMMQAFNGAGDTATPTWINFFCFWLFQIPLAWLLSKTLGLGPTGVYIAIAVSYSLSAVVGILLFRRGKWKEKDV